LKKLQWAEFIKGICLRHYIHPISFLVLILLSFGKIAISYASDSVGVNQAAVIRSQLQIIADEVVDQAKLDTMDRVSVYVEGEAWRSLVENAFIEALQKRNYITVLGTGTKSFGQTLQIFLLGTDIRVREINTKLFERSISTSIEVRKIVGTSRQASLLGTYSRQALDTAQVYPSLQLPLAQKDEKNTVLQTLLTPLIVVSGAVLIIYLFFTVRS
jgi:hypothetical protein